ncbi:TPA: ubiquitin specific peptidase 17-like [Bos taurus]|nr:TPA: ubiquitin specific peptidase 17-like [Bos taurus]
MGALSRQAADRATCGGVAFGKEVDVLREGAGPPPQVAPQTRRLRVEREEPRFLGHREPLLPLAHPATSQRRRGPLRVGVVGPAPLVRMPFGDPLSLRAVPALRRPSGTPAEDAHEFLMFTLNAMQQGCLSASQPSGHASEDTTVIRQIFGGTWRSQIQCLRCLGVSDTFDPYLDISLDITAAQSVEQALRELVKPEKLDADNAYDCGVCLRKVPATKRLTLHSTSQVLVLVLKRFTPVSGAKRAQEVRYPQCLDLQPYTSERKAGPLGYVLYAVLVHSGWSCERGHYFCYVRAGNGQWYKMDDAKVTACDETAALSQSAYVLFYAREGAWEGGAGGGAAAPVGADPTDPGQPAGDASGRAPGSEESPGDTDVEGMSLEQWRRLQEHSRPKPALELRKVQSALPAGAVVIHQSKHGGGRNRTPPQQEHERLDRPSTDTPPPGPKNVGNGPCAGGRARATKGKNKKPRPSLGLWR